MKNTLLMNRDMVRATIAGTKTQTRRIADPKKTTFSEARNPFTGDFQILFEKKQYPFAETIFVKETHGFDEKGNIVFRANGGWCDAPNFAKHYLQGGKWKPSIFMRVKYSRISLDVRGYRLERLQDITEEDAIREGARFIKGDSRSGWSHTFENNLVFDTAKASFINLWCSIYGADSWNKNPLVWVTSFRAIILEK